MDRTGFHPTLPADDLARARASAGGAGAAAR